MALNLSFVAFPNWMSSQNLEEKKTFIFFLKIW
jgi:hypothetical protein